MVGRNEAGEIVPVDSTFVCISAAGPRRDLDKGAREQPYWDAHERFVDRLVEAGFIVMGGPLPDEGGALIIVRAPTEADVRETLRDDPWYVHGVLELVDVKRWEVYVDRWRT